VVEATVAGGPVATDVRRLWPDVLEEVKRRRRFTWMTISQHAQVAEVSDGTLVLSFANPGARDSFLKGGSDDVLRDALVEVMGADLRISALLESEMKGGRPAPAAAAPVEADSPDSPASPDVPDADAAGTVPAADEWRAEPQTAATTGRAALLAQARARAAEVAEPSVVIDVGDRDDPDVADTDAESLLRDMLHAEVIDD
jgi:DNA polymerase-3 subunit gamma/tau